jgi:hypothetical protein
MVRTTRRTVLGVALPIAVALAPCLGAGSAAAQPHGRAKGHEHAEAAKQTPASREAEQKAQAARAAEAQRAAAAQRAEQDLAARRAAAQRAEQDLQARRLAAQRAEQNLAARRVAAQRAEQQRRQQLALQRSRIRSTSAAMTAVPPGQMPPPGMCRIWIDGVPPGHQPAPTDCATAERTRPSNARVLYGSSVGGEVTRRYPRTTNGYLPMPGGWPAFEDALRFQRGARPASVAQWAPGATRSVFADDAGGHPSVARFYDASGHLLALWYDRNHDGLVEAAKIYRNGHLAGSYQR